jgi:hypothetical protein
MEEIKNHLWNKKRTETLKVADLQGYLAQFEPAAEVQLGVVQMRGAAMWRHPIRGFKFVFGGDVPALLITVGKAKQIKDGDRNG